MRFRHPAHLDTIGAVETSFGRFAGEKLSQTLSRRTLSEVPKMGVRNLQAFHTVAMTVASIAMISAADVSRAEEMVDLTPERARMSVAPLYEALNEPSKKDIKSLLEQATKVDYQSCSNNQECVDREKLSGAFQYLGKMIPDLYWEIKEVITSGDRIVVRGEATGTPVLDFLGMRPTGRSFRTMSIDTFTVKDGKLSRAYHIENWTSAIKQLGAPS